MNVRQKKLELIEAMNRARALEPSSFVPNKLLDTLIEKLNLKNDAELCRVLEVQPPIISKIRHGKLSVGATILLRMHEKSEIAIRDLKELPARHPGPRRHELLPYHSRSSSSIKRTNTLPKKPSPKHAVRFSRTSPATTPQTRQVQPPIARPQPDHVKISPPSRHSDAHTVRPGSPAASS